ncbi:hemerythrin domain-containing protein [Spirillospora sp. NPDC048911]|uniref:hemerythrin domain-containing protein n=1 Tax=Spirillospora sp. NPDC048911 TaxID=3364527 RepID=UPI0037219825
MSAIMEHGAPGRFDLTMLYAAYGAFRRETARLADARLVDGRHADGRHADASGSDVERAVSGLPPDGLWVLFRFHWRAQHAAERRALWTVMRGKDPACGAVLAEMDDQAVRLVPLLDTVDAAIQHGDWGVLADVAPKLRDAVHAHLDHKEARVLPLIHEALTPFEWATFDVEFRREVGVAGFGVFLSWLLDGADETTSRAVLRLMPPPVRLLHRTGWLPRHPRRAVSP